MESSSVEGDNRVLKKMSQHTLDLRLMSSLVQIVFNLPSSIKCTNSNLYSVYIPTLLGYALEDLIPTSPI